MTALFLETPYVRPLTRQDMIIEAIGGACSQLTVAESGIDPILRLMDRTFKEPVWEYEGSRLGTPIIPGQLHAKQLEMLTNPAKHRFALWGNQAQPGDEPVLTPEGWVSIGTLRPGDRVIAEDGTPTTVLGVYPQGVRPLYRLTFDDGASTRCTDDHLWRVLDPEARFRRPEEVRGDGYQRVAGMYGQWSVIPLTSIRDRWGDAPKPRRRCAIPVPLPVRMESRPVMLDPYLVGVLLGDGGLTGLTPVLTSADESLIAEVASLLPDGCTLRPAGQYGYRIGFNGRGNPLTSALRHYGLMGHGAATKFVPRDYLMNDVPVRLAVLQGLMDTDGSASLTGTVEFTTVSRQLADDVVYLVRSLGGKARWLSRHTTYTHNGDLRTGLLSYRVHIRLPRTKLFRLERKQARVFDATSTCDERVLRRIEPEGEGEAVCIAVDHPSQTYVTRDFIVTHNTGKSTIGAVDLVLTALGRHPVNSKLWMPPTVQWASALSWELWENILLPELLTWIPAWRIIDAPEPYKQSTKRHITLRADNGAVSRITGKAAEQGRAKYQSARIHQLWADEEHPEDIYNEVQPRLLRFGGRTINTLTPLKGLTWIYHRIYEPHYLRGKGMAA